MKQNLSSNGKLKEIFKRNQEIEELQIERMKVKYL